MILAKFQAIAGGVVLNVLLSGMTPSMAIAEDVQVFDHPPTVGELESALIKPKAKTRSIVINGGDASQSSAAPSAPKGPDAIAMTIPFKLNSAEILTEATPYIESVAGVLHKNRSVRLLVEGHTDIIGTHDYNVRLSKARADAVKAILVQNYGIAADRLNCIGLGPDDPLTGSLADDPKNRRVQFRAE